MKKHMRIKAASCLDMIDAFNDKIAELDPSYVSGSRQINAGSDVCPDCGNPAEDCVCGSCGNKKSDKIESADSVDQEYIQGMDNGVINEEYVDEMMQYVADTTTDPEINAVCSWSVEGSNLVFVLTGLDNDSVEEYTCPLSDLTGDIDTDIDYVLESIQ